MTYYERADMVMFANGKKDSNIWCNYFENDQMEVD